MRKPKLADRKKFCETIRDVAIELGATVVTDVEKDPNYKEYNCELKGIPTKYGQLKYICAYSWECSMGSIGWIAMRFQAPISEHQAKETGCNPYSGKWNIQLSPSATIEDYAREFRRLIKSVSTAH